MPIRERGAKFERFNTRMGINPLVDEIPPYETPFFPSNLKSQLGPFTHEHCGFLTYSIYTRHYIQRLIEEKMQFGKPSDLMDLKIAYISHQQRKGEIELALLDRYRQRTGKEEYLNPKQLAYALLDQKRYERDPAEKLRHYGQELNNAIPEGRFKTITLDRDGLAKLPYWEIGADSGSSGSGKTFHLLNLYHECLIGRLRDVTFEKRVTTRKKRPGEGLEEGYFIHPRDFSSLSSLFEVSWSKDIYTMMSEREKYDLYPGDMFVKETVDEVDNSDRASIVYLPTRNYILPQYGYLYEVTDYMKFFALPSPAILHRETLWPPTFFEEVLRIFINCPDDIRADRILGRQPDLPTTNKAEWLYRTEFDKTNKVRKLWKPHVTIDNYGKNEELALKEMIEFMMIVSGIWNRLRNPRI